MGGALYDMQQFLAFEFTSTLTKLTVAEGVFFKVDGGVGVTREDWIAVQAHVSMLQAFCAHYGWDNTGQKCARIVKEMYDRTSEISNREIYGSILIPLKIGARLV